MRMTLRGPVAATMRVDTWAHVYLCHLEGIGIGGRQYVEARVTVPAAMDGQGVQATLIPMATPAGGWPDPQVVEDEALLAGTVHDRVLVLLGDPLFQAEAREARRGLQGMWCDCPGTPEACLDAVTAMTPADWRCAEAARFPVIQGRGPDHQPSLRDPDHQPSLRDPAYRYSCRVARDLAGLTAGQRLTVAVLLDDAMAYRDALAAARALG